jgi:hypothetical protein
MSVILQIVRWPIRGLHEWQVMIEIWNAKAYRCHLFWNQIAWTHDSVGADIEVLSLAFFIFDSQDGRCDSVVVSWCLMICVEINFVHCEEFNNW